MRSATAARMQSCSQAAEQGRLNTREDYRREVLRLLEDKTYYAGEIDPGFDR